MTPEELIVKALEKAVTSGQSGVTSDLIKIGLPILGTVIGAYLGYIASRKQAEKNFEAQIKTAVLARTTDLDSRFLEIKLEHFMEMQTLIDQFTNTVADYSANVKNWNDHKQNGNAELQVQTRNKHSTLQEDFYKGFLLLGSAESKLLVLGKTKMLDTFESLTEKSKRIYESVYIQNDDISNDDISRLVEDFKRLKYQLLIELGNEIEAEHARLLQRSNEVS